MKLTKLEKIKSLIQEAEEHGYKFYEKDNLTAGVRLRKVLQEARRLSQELRIEVQIKKTEISLKRYSK